MWTMIWSTVVNSVFAFITTSSTSTRGLATMVLISAFIISMTMSRFTPLIVVISVFINVASTMIILPIYGSAFQIIARKRENVFSMLYVNPKYPQILSKSLKTVLLIRFYAFLTKKQKIQTSHTILQPLQVITGNRNGNQLF